MAMIRTPITKAAFKRLSFTFEKKLSTKTKVTIGIASLPIVSALQGIYFLRDYRINHRDAPRPISPSSGLAVVDPVDRDSLNTTNKEEDNQHHHNHVNDYSNIPPLRLYVVGDSLAAGTGISKSGTPILPESIARSLSKQLGGRPVYWFCHGTNGAGANRINSDIQNHFINCNDTVNKEDQVNVSENQILFKDKFEQQIIKWKRLILEFVHKRIISRPLLNANLETEKSETPGTPNSDSFQKMLQNSSRKNAYDVVVVLTGLNDLKGFFPFLANDICRNHTSFKEELRNIFVTLKDKMKKHQIEELTNDQPLKTTQHIDDDSTSTTTATTGTPIVVLPALPVGLVPLFRYPPLCWFAQLIFDFIDRQKKDLSNEYPGQILFVNPPTSEMADLFEKTKNQLQAENVGLLLQDVSMRTKNKIEELMREYMKEYVEKNERNDGDLETEKNFEESIEQNRCSEEEESYNGSSLISIDKVHPNDDGYEFWGQHIGAAIFQEIKIHKSYHTYSHGRVDS